MLSDAYRHKQAVNKSRTGTWGLGLGRGDLGREDVGLGNVGTRGDWRTFSRT